MLFGEPNTQTHDIGFRSRFPAVFFGHLLQQCCHLRVRARRFLLVDLFFAVLQTYANLGQVLLNLPLRLCHLLEDFDGFGVRTLM